MCAEYYTCIIVFFSGLYANRLLKHRQSFATESSTSQEYSTGVEQDCEAMDRKVKPENDCGESNAYVEIKVETEVGIENNESELYPGWNAESPDGKSSDWNCGN